MSARDTAEMDEAMMAGLVPLRTPPWSNEAEQSVLAGLLIENEAWSRIANVLTAESFFARAHTEIFTVIGIMLNSGKPVDVITVFERLKTRKTDEETGGLVYLNMLASSIPSARNIGRYAEIVAERALSRALLTAADEASEIAFGDLPAHEKTDQIMGKFAALQQRGQRSMPVPMQGLLCERVDHYNDLASGNVDPGISTGIASIDNALTGGLKPGKVIVLAARPSIGKSALALAILLNIAQAGHTCLFLSQEMENTELTDRAISNMAGINLKRLQTGKMSDAEWGRLAEAVDKLERLPLLFDDQPALTLHDIRAKAMSLRARKLKVMVIDYLQLCSGSKTGRRENRNTDIEEISRGVKELAKEMGITILALSQLNRDSEKRNTPKPGLADLRDSGAIEQDADAVGMLWRVRSYDWYQTIGLYFPKNRQGTPNVEMNLEFKGQFQRWAESQPENGIADYGAPPKQEGFST